MASVIDQVGAILRTINPDDPSGQWSLYDIGRRLPNLPAGYIAAAVAELCPDGGRYVGGTSKYLYHLEPEPCGAKSGTRVCCYRHGHKLPHRFVYPDDPSGWA